MKNISIFPTIFAAALILLSGCSRKVDVASFGASPLADAIKNTNTKITHRLVSEDDCKAVAESMGLSKEQRLILPKLLVGQCVVTTSLSTDKYWIKVNKMK